MQRQRVSLILVVLVVLAPMALGAIEKISPDPKGVALCGKLLTALSIEDDAKRLQAVLPLVHKSLKNRSGDDLDANIKPYSYKKATQGAKLYQNPPKIYEVHKGNVITVGFKETAERGRKDKYFVDKKAGVAGRPAPIVVFWPDGGGEPTILDMGSL